LEETLTERIVDGIMSRFWIWKPETCSRGGY